MIPRVLAWSKWPWYWSFWGLVRRGGGDILWGLAYMCGVWVVTFFCVGWRRGVPHEQDGLAPVKLATRSFGGPRVMNDPAVKQAYELINWTLRPPIGGLMANWLGFGGANINQSNFSIGALVVSLVGAVRAPPGTG